MSHTPYIPAAPEVTSLVSDIFPNFEWLAVGDPAYPPGWSDGISYDLKLMTTDGAGNFSVEVATITGISGMSVVGDSVLYEFMSGLTDGEYQVLVRSYDGSTRSDWSAGTEFAIVVPVLDPSKVIVTAPLFFDPKLGEVRFFDPGTWAVYERAKFKPETDVLL